MTCFRAKTCVLRVSSIVLAVHKHTVGGPSTCTANSRWWTAAFWKRVDKSPYIGNDLTDRNNIWIGDAHCHCEQCSLLKFQIFINPRWWTAAILKTVKSPYLSNRWCMLPNNVWLCQPKQHTFYLTNKTTRCTITKFASVSLCCKSHHFRTANIEIVIHIF